MVGLALVALVAAACSSAATGAPATQPGGPTPGLTGAATAAATASVGPAATGPATFELSVGGDANVRGTWSKSFGVDCNNPTLAGEDLLFFAQSPDTKARSRPRG